MPCPDLRVNDPMGHLCRFLDALWIARRCALPVPLAQALQVKRVDWRQAMAILAAVGVMPSDPEWARAADLWQRCQGGSR